MSSVIEEAMAAAIAHRIMPKDDVEMKAAVAQDIKSEAQLRCIDRKAELTTKVVKMLREEKAQKEPNVDAIEAYQSRLEELTKVS